MSSFDQFLAPISPDKPCGEDLSNSQDFIELDTLAEGKPETQFSSAVPPDWKVVYTRCTDLLAKSKNIRVAVVLCLAALQREGWTGGAAALDMTSKILRQYWDTLYPLLDAEDKNNPIERYNILSALNNPIGTFDDNFAYIQNLTQAPLTNSPRLGKLSFAVMQPDYKGENAPNSAQIDAAFLDTPKEDLAVTSAAIDQAIAAVADMASFLGQIPGDMPAPTFDLLQAQLAKIRKLLDGHLSVANPAAAESVAVGGMTATVSEPSGGGTIRSRADVENALQRICDFYQHSEPSSPLPLLLQRAKRLVNSDFLRIIEELTPEAANQMKTVTGYKDPSTPPTT
jgi:type VI secretion system protein ImpA